MLKVHFVWYDDLTFFKIQGMGVTLEDPLKETYEQEDSLLTARETKGNVSKTN